MCTVRELHRGVFGHRWLQVFLFFFKLIPTEQSRDVHSALLWFMACLCFYTEGRGFFFILVSMASWCSGQWNLLSPLWSCNTQMSQGSKHIAVIHVPLFDGLWNSVQLNSTALLWILHVTFPSSIQVTLKLRQWLLLFRTNCTFSPHQIVASSLNTDQVWILSHLLFICSSMRSPSCGPSGQFHLKCIIQQFMHETVAQC